MRTKCSSARGIKWVAASSNLASNLRWHGTFRFYVARQNGDEIDVTPEQVQFTIVQPSETILPDSEPETLVEERA